MDERALDDAVRHERNGRVHPEQRLALSKLYPDPLHGLHREKSKPIVDHFTVLSRIPIFELIVDYFNSKTAADETLSETIRAINRVHHEDESRHIAFGCQLVRVLFERMKEVCTPEEVQAACRYVDRYITASLHGMYSVDVYREAGIPDPAGFRRRL